MQNARVASIFMLNLIFVWPVKLVAWIICKLESRRYNVDFDDYADDEWTDDSDNDEQIQDELTKYDNLPEMPDMRQTFKRGDVCIGVEFVSMCPDETAHIRIIGDTTFSQLYKRRVYRDIDNARYFKLNNEKFCLDDRRTQPIDPTQAKNGK